MGFRDFFRPLPEPVVGTDTIQVSPWEDILRNYDLVEVVHDQHQGDSFVVVTPRETQAVTMADPPPRSEVDLRELGSSSPSPFVSFARNEYNISLQGLKGLEKYDQMRRSDGVVRGTLRLVKTPPLAGRWFIQPASQSTRDVNAANFVWRQLTEFMSISWNQVLTESLLMCDFGHYSFEKVWEERVIDGKERLIWSKLAPRHPMDEKKWWYDKNGGPVGVEMYTANPNDPGTFGVSPTGPASPGFLDQQYVAQRDVFIPIQKLLVFTFDREAGNLEGISLLRSAYKHWYFKEQLYKIDAIQKERHGIGVPVIVLPVGFTVDDKNFANELGRNLRTNERAHVVLPPNWELIFAKMEGQLTDALASIEMHDKAIRSNILAEFLGDQGGESERQDMFLKATRFLANVVCDTFNDYAIKELVDYNFSRVGTPRLKVRRIGEQGDWRTLSFAIRNLVGAGVITPDDKLEAHLREEMDLPEADPATARELPTPQNPGGNEGEEEGEGKQNMVKNKPGMPRQTKPSATPPRGNAGTDKSGGK